MRYVWFEGDGDIAAKEEGEPYLANEVLVHEGYAVLPMCPPDVE